VSTFAVIGTFYRRWERTAELLRRVMVESTLAPDEMWVMCEDALDAKAVGEIGDSRVRVYILPTPRHADGRYAVIPYSNKINWALDRTQADYIVYLDNGSMPAPDKYRTMVAALDEHPEWGAVYVGQQRTGYMERNVPANQTIGDAYGVLNYTQVMHRRTADRWTLDMQWADPDLADAMFWRDLHASLGDFYPVGGDDAILDVHHMEDRKAVGL